MDRILVIEDDPDVQKALQHAFETAGYGVEVSGDGMAGIKSFQSSPPSAVVLDLCLPGRPGKEVAREIKLHDPSVPIVVLSAITDVTDKVLLLEMGADDYVTKPFSPRELLARVEVALRRSTRRIETNTFEFGDVIVDFREMKVTRDGEVVALTAQEFKLLKFFASNQNRAVTRDELLDQVWGYECYPSSRTVDNHVLRLRHKLERDPTEPLHFRTMHSIGYKFVP